MKKKKIPVRKLMTWQYFIKVKINDLRADLSDGRGGNSETNSFFNELKQNINTKYWQEKRYIAKIRG